MCSIMRLLVLGYFIFQALMVVAQAESIQITDSHGNLTFEQAPTRVVVANWTLAEQVLELGIIPLGIADIEGYRKNIIRPSIPTGIVDLGSRMGPNLEKIKALKPDVIIIGYSQRPLVRKLANIAPVVYFNNFSKHYVNGEKAQERFFQLATLFNKVDFARGKIAQRNRRLAELKAQLEQRFTEGLPRVTVIMPHNASQAWVLGENSQAQFTLALLGFTPAIVQRASKYGATKVQLKDLNITDGCLLYLPNEYFDIQQSASWQRLAQIKAGCFLPLPQVAIYGGAMSIQYLAEEIVQAFVLQDAK